MRIIRRKTRAIKIGNLKIGGNHPIAIQSMTKTKTSDIAKTIKQIKELESAGCEIVRVAVKDSQDSKAIKRIKREVKIPLIADIHFNWHLAINAIDNGVDKIRLNPGNIYNIDQIREIVRCAKLNRIPIRVGVNSGSLRSPKSSVLGCKSQAKNMVKSALDYIKILEGFKFFDIVVSLKASNIFDTIEAYRRMSELCDYPFHLGMTATGPAYLGTIKSSIALSALLLAGIGDTLRVSLTDEPRLEVKVAQTILETVGLRNFGPEIISCPTCGRCEVELVKIVNALEDKLAAWPLGRLVSSNRKPLKVAIMGCVVNGPGEASEADIGVAFGKKEGLLFRGGKAIKKIAFANCLDSLLKEMERIYA